MRYRQTPRILLAGMLLLLSGNLLAESNPAPPDGWTSTAAGPVTIYSLANAAAAVEFRLHPAAAPTDALSVWFTHRLHSPPAGIDISSFGDAKQTDTATYTVVQKGTRLATGTAVVVIDMGCQTKGGAFRYGELILPPDMAVINSSASSAASVMARACIETLAAQMPTAPSTPSKPQAQTVKTSMPAVDGIKGKQIEAILFSWAQVYRVTGLQLEENAYLLLKDGSYRTQVPQAPLEEFDVAADKASNPKKWGRWRKEGGKYLLAELGAANFHTPEHQSIKLPARTGEILNGSWSAGSGGTIGTTGYWSTSSVTLTADGRFTRNSSGGSGGSSSPGADYNVSVLTVHNDEGSASAVGSRNFGGGGSSKNGQTIANRSGTYKLNGYTMELHYDDGRIVRQLFFTDDDRSYIWFAGAQLRKEKR
jgi:hypothetical protein